MRIEIGALLQPGEWSSPLKAPDIARAGVSASWPQIVGDDIWWVETRPIEEGRRVIVSQQRGDLISAPFSASHSVHEYGGRSYLGILEAGRYKIYFANKSDQRIYLKVEGEDPRPLTPDTNRSHRYAEFIKVGDEIWCVREIAIGNTCQRELIAINDMCEIRVLMSGHQFFAHPRICPDGKRISWISWEHPRMPWDGTELYLAEIRDGSLVDKRVLAGSDHNPVLSPEWLNNETLIYLDESNGWWNPWRVNLEGAREPIIQERSEWGFPAWQLGYRGVSIMKDGRFIGIHGPVDDRRLAIVDPESGSFVDFESAYNYIAPTFDSNGERIVAFAASNDSFSTLVEFDPHSQKANNVIRPNPFLVDLSFAPKIEEISIPASGHDVKVIMHYAKNPNYSVTGPTPLLVQVHGGPTAHSFAIAKLDYLYWTSRGFTIADINYGGSTGYGADYRHLLDGQWGIIDYEDVIATVEHLVRIGIADPKRCFISGGSAGGFTVLNALIHSDVFAAGADHYGVAELSGLATDTHDFESRYLDSMIGPYPERKDLYDQRSPLTHADKLSTPLIIFQGLDDKVVPPSQSEAFRDVCIRKGITHKYFAFEGEGHGFNKALSIITSLEEELTFFGAAGGFKPSL